MSFSLDMDFIKQTINILADVVIFVLFVRVIFSWLRVRSGKIAHLLHEVTEPILRPIQRLLPRTGMIDFSPLVAFLLIEVARTLFNQAL